MAALGSTDKDTIVKRARAKLRHVIATSIPRNRSTSLAVRIVWPRGRSDHTTRGAVELRLQVRSGGVLRCLGGGRETNPSRRMLTDRSLQLDVGRLDDRPPFLRVGFLL